MLGTIQITIISAKLTHDTETFGKMDPYCALTLKSATLKTEIHKGGGKFPSWKQNFGIRTTDVSDIIEFEVWDHDAMSKDDLVGVGYILVSHLVESLDKKEEWFPLSYKDKKAGEVLISFQFFPDYINVQEIPFIPNPCPVQPPYGYVNPSHYQPIVPSTENELIEPPKEETQQPPIQQPIFIPPNVEVEFIPPNVEVEFIPPQNLIQPPVFIPQEETQQPQIEQPIYIPPIVDVEFIPPQNLIQPPVFIPQEEIKQPENEQPIFIPPNVEVEFIPPQNLIQPPVFLIKEEPNIMICPVEKKKKDKTHHNGLVFVNKEKLHGHEYMNHLYFTTNIHHPIEEIEEILITGKSKDQGHCDEAESSSWVEVAVVNQNQKEQTERKTLFKNYKLENYEKWTEVIKDPYFLKELRKHGNQLGVYARSLGQNWICEIKKCRIEIHLHGQSHQPKHNLGSKERIFHFERKEMLKGTQNMNTLYIKTKIDEKIKTVQEIEIRGMTKDQGWATAAYSDSWIEAVVVDGKGGELSGRKRVFENYKLANFEKWSRKINDNLFVEGLQKPGAQIEVYARSQYGGWICEVKEIEIIVKCIVE